MEKERLAYVGKGECENTYSNQKMVVEVLGLGVLLRFLRNSSSLVQIDTLY